MRQRSPLVEARIAQNAFNKRKQISQAQLRGLVVGVKRASKVAKEMIESGWTDMKKFEAEVLRRVRTGKKS
jgi:hypothetical protein